MTRTKGIRLGERGEEFVRSAVAAVSTTVQLRGLGVRLDDAMQKVVVAMGDEDKEHTRTHTHHHLHKE